jgi:cleavage and polyadenylation specificity factor subunit 5
MFLLFHFQDFFVFCSWPMSTLDWTVYEIANYNGSFAPDLRPKLGVPGTPKPSWVKRWATEGMRRTVRAVMVVHSDSVPHYLVFQQKSESGTLQSFLFGGKLQEGESERDGMARLLKSFILKSKSGDVCEWRVGESLGKFWRPDFDENVYPYIPPHVTRPKEEITLLQIILPPKCVFALRKHVTVTAMPLHDILRDSSKLHPLIGSLPSLTSKYTFYNYVAVTSR